MKSALTLLALLAACAHAPEVVADQPAAGDAILTIKSNLGDADVILDGQVIGPVKRLRGGLAIDPGHHQLELRHDDYFSAYADLQLARAEKKTLSLDLAPILP